MRLIYLLDRFNTIGGIEKIISEKANAWVEYFNVDVFIIVTYNQDCKQSYFKLNERIKIVYINEKHRLSTNNPSIRNIKNIISYSKKIKKIFQTINPDYIFIPSRVSINKFLVPIISKKTINIVEFHSSYYSFILAQNRMNFVRKLLLYSMEYIHRYFDQKFDKIVLLNKDEEAYYNYKNSIVIPNFISDINSVNLSHKTNSVIACYRFDKIKRIDLLIQIWEQIDSKINGWTLNLYGDGELFDSIKNEVDSKTFNNKIVLHGSKKNSEIPYFESKIYTMTSKSESFSMVLLEAQAASVVVISFDVPTGPRNILSGKDSFLIKDNDIVEYSNKLLFLMQNEGEREEMAKKAYNNVQQFSKQKIMTKWHDLLSSMMQKT